METIGYIAGFLTAATMLPQVIKSIKTKKVRDLSLYMILMYVFNAALWVVYGISIRAVPLILADSFAFIMGFAQLIVKVRYNGRCKRCA